jgi:hypothetical protein
VKEERGGAFDGAGLALELHVLFAQELLNIWPSLRFANCGVVDIDLLYPHGRIS